MKNEKIGKKDFLISRTGFFLLIVVSMMLFFCSTSVHAGITPTPQLNCDQMTCEEIIASPTLRSAVETYDVNNDFIIDEDEANTAVSDYIIYGRITKDQACAASLFYLSSCNLAICTEGGACYPIGATCCLNDVMYICGGGGPTTTTTLPPIPGDIKLPLCTFGDERGVWAKPKNCNWDNRALMGRTQKAKCTTYLITDHKTSTSSAPNEGWVYTMGPAAIGEATDLCVMDSTNFDALPMCPFSGGATGDVFAKPVFKEQLSGFEWTWDTGKCKVGSECSVVNTLVTVKDFFGVDLPDELEFNIGPIVIRIPFSDALDLRVETHANTPQRVYCGTRFWPIFTGAVPCELCVSKPYDCTPGECDTTAKRYCASNGMWSDQDAQVYCDNCNHCGDGKCNCGETAASCADDCATTPPTEQCQYKECDGENTLPCWCRGTKLPAGYVDKWCCEDATGGHYPTQETCMRTTARKCGTCDEYCASKGSSDGRCALLKPSGYERPSPRTDNKCITGYCYCKTDYVTTEVPPGETTTTSTTVPTKCKDYCPAVYGVEGDCKLVCDSNWFHPPLINAEPRCTLGKCCCKRS